MAKYKVGDKVRIVDQWAFNGSQNRNGGMDLWLGKIMTIRCAKNGYYEMNEDAGLWYWDSSTIAGLAESNQKIEITTDGTTTVARLYNGKDVVESVSVIRQEGLSFDFNADAMSAFTRLMCKEDTSAKLKRKAKYKVGDKIRVVRFVPTFPVDCRENYAGRVFTIKNVYETQYKQGVAYGIGATYVVYEGEIEPAGYTGRAVCVLPGMGSDKVFTAGRIYTFVDKETVDDNGNKSLLKREDDIYIGDGVVQFLKIKE